MTLTSKDLPTTTFFTSLITGTKYFHQGEFDKAIGVWEEAIQMRRDSGRGGRIDTGPEFRGSLADVPLVGLLHLVSSSAQSGVAVVTSDYAYKEIFFREGWIVFGRTTRSDERIGGFLVKGGIISAANLERLVYRAQKDGIRLGRYLVTRGLLSERELTELLEFQIKEILCDLFSWREGDFYFSEQEVDDEDVVVSYTPLDLALVAARRALDFSTFRRMIPHNRVIFRIPPDIEKAKQKALGKLDANERFIFSLIDGRRNIDQLIKFSGNEETSTIDILYRLLLKGLIKRTKDIGTYEDTEFNEVSRFLRTFLEISRMILNVLNAEVGVQSSDVLNRAHGSLPEKYRVVFREIPMRHDMLLDANKILRNISLYHPDPSERFVFIDAFNAFINNVIAEMSRILGKALTERAIAEVDKVRMDIFRFYPDSPLKRRVLAAFDKIVAQYAS